MGADVLAGFAVGTGNALPLTSGPPVSLGRGVFALAFEDAEAVGEGWVSPVFAAAALPSGCAGFADAGAALEGIMV